MAEISDSDLLVYQRAMSVLQTLDNKGGLDFKRLLKKTIPELSVPEIDAAAPHVERIDSLEKKFDDYLQTNKNTEIENKIRDDIEYLRKAGYQDEGIERIKKLALERKIPSMMDAATVFEKQNPPIQAKQSGFTPGRWDFDKFDEQSERETELFNDPDAFFDHEAERVLKEFKE